jgi:hypothetical protein
MTNYTDYPPKPYVSIPSLTALGEYTDQSRSIFHTAGMYQGLSMLSGAMAHAQAEVKALPF